MFPIHDSKSDMPLSALLLKAKQEAGQAEKEAVLERFKPLVLKHARLGFRRVDHFRRVQPVFYDDLVQAGVLALLRAIKNFDPDYNDTFPAYAEMYVSGAIQREVKKSYEYYAATGRSDEFDLHGLGSISEEEEIPADVPTELVFEDPDFERADLFVEHDLLSAWFRGLSGKDVNLLRRLFWLGTSQAEVAREDSVSRNAVNKRVKRILGTAIDLFNHNSKE